MRRLTLVLIIAGAALACSGGQGRAPRQPGPVVDDTLVPGDALLDDADTVEVRPVISGGSE